MYRYTTPTLPVTIEDVNFSEVDFFRVALQIGATQLLFVVPADDASVDPQTHTIYISLTQEQTASLATGMAKIQARIKYSSGSVQATNKATVTIDDVLDQVII